MRGKPTAAHEKLSGRWQINVTAETYERIRNIPISEDLPGRVRELLLPIIIEIETRKRLEAARIVAQEIKDQT